MATNNKSKNSKFSLFLSKHWWKIGVLILFAGSLAFLGFNKYLDQQNVNNMKQLLSDFEKLKTDVENETGEEFYIQADCSTGGEKFKPVYSCKIDLITTKAPASEEVLDSYYLHEKLNLNKNEKCGLLSELGYSGTKDLGNYYTCIISVRKTNQNEAEKIFYDYDTSPGRPF